MKVTAFLLAACDASPTGICEYSVMSTRTCNADIRHCGPFWFSTIPKRCVAMSQGSRSKSSCAGADAGKRLQRSHLPRRSHNLCVEHHERAAQSGSRGSARCAFTRVNLKLQSHDVFSDHCCCVQMATCSSAAQTQRLRVQLLQKKNSHLRRLGFALIREGYAPLCLEACTIHAQRQPLQQIAHAKMFASTSQAASAH